MSVISTRPERAVEAAPFLLEIGFNLASRSVIFESRFVPVRTIFVLQSLPDCEPSSEKCIKGDLTSSVQFHVE